MGDLVCPDIAIQPDQYDFPYEGECSTRHMEVVYSQLSGVDVMEENNFDLYRVLRLTQYTHSSALFFSSFPTHL